MDNKNLQSNELSLQSSIMKAVRDNGGFVSQGTLLTKLNGQCCHDTLISLLEGLVVEGALVEMRLTHKTLGGYSQPFYFDGDVEWVFTDNRNKR